MVRSFRQYFLCSFSSLSCGQLATETAYCGSYSLQSDKTLLSTAFHWVGLCGWVCVNVWGGVHHGDGNAPRYHYSIIATYITEPFSLLFLYFLFLFLTKSEISFFAVSSSFLSLWQQVYLQHLAQLVNTGTEQLRTSLSHQHATNAKAARALTVPLWFREIALAHSGKGSAAMRRLPHSALLKSTTSFVGVANKRWNKESRPTDANNKLTWLWCLECKEPWANVWHWTSPWVACAPDCFTTPEPNTVACGLWVTV